MNGNQASRRVALLLTITGFAAFAAVGALVALQPQRALAAPAEDEPKADDKPEGPSTETNDGYAPEPRKLTDEEINRIRYMELRAMRGLTGVDHVTVKIPREVQEEFLKDMTGHENFRGKRSRQDFLKRTPPQKLHIIAHYKGAKYADKVQILTDPEIFLEFRKHVMPQVIRGCATSGCHNSLNDHAYGFKLFKDPKKLPSTTFANFLTLNDYMKDGRKMINRNDPSRSLMLTYMLPKSEVPPEYQHPGDVEYRPLFQSHKHPRFQRMMKWVGSLKIPEEDYGVRLMPEARMADTPKDDKNPDDDGKKPDDDKPDDKSRDS